MGIHRVNFGRPGQVQLAEGENLGPLREAVGVKKLPSNGGRPAAVQRANAASSNSPPIGHSAEIRSNLKEIDRLTSVVSQQQSKASAALRTDHVGDLIGDRQMVGHLQAVLVQKCSTAETARLHSAGAAPATPVIPFPVSSFGPIWLDVRWLMRLSAGDTEGGIRPAIFGSIAPTPGIPVAISIPHFSDLGFRKHPLKLESDQASQIGQ